jgi:hypothetical protein
MFIDVYYDELRLIMLSLISDRGQVSNAYAANDL